MEPLPHHYSVNSSASSEGSVLVEATGLPTLETAPPEEFGGPGDKWSPESLLVAAVADCFILTFRAIARASKLDWQELNCSAEGTLERVERVTRFTAISVKARLSVPAGTDTEKANKLLHKAEESCLITNSLLAERSLETQVTEV